MGFLRLSAPDRVSSSIQGVRPPSLVSGFTRYARLTRSSPSRRSDRLATQAIGRIHRYGQLKTANILHLLVPSTVDHDTFSNLNEVPISSLVKASREPILNPLRKKTREYVPLKRTKDARTKAEEAAWKKLDAEAAKERAWAGELPFDAGKGASAKADKGKGKAVDSKASSRKSSKTAGASGKGKKTIEIVSDDSDAEIVISSDDDSEEEDDFDEASNDDADSDIEILVSSAPS